MHRLLAGACLMMLFALAVVAPANAGDFKGFYIGGNIGGAKGSSVNAQTTTVFSPTGYFATSSVPAIASSGNQNIDPGGFTGGGQAGFNFQHKSLVFGLEADYGMMDMSGQKSTTTNYPCCPTTHFTVTQFVGTDWLMTLRPRVGFTGGPVLVYGTGGVAFTNAEYTALFTDTFATAHENGGKRDDTQTGWAAGVGAEFKTGKHFSLRGEYLRVGFGSASTTTSNNLTAFTPPIAFSTNVFTHSAGDLHGNLFRFGFNFYFK